LEGCLEGAASSVALHYGRGMIQFQHLCPRGLLNYTVKMKVDVRRANGPLWMFGEGRVDEI
jgi:hypothetical protein